MTGRNANLKGQPFLSSMVGTHLRTINKNVISVTRILVDQWSAFLNALHKQYKKAASHKNHSIKAQTIIGLTTATYTISTTRHRDRSGTSGFMLYLNNNTILKDVWQMQSSNNTVNQQFSKCTNVCRDRLEVCSKIFVTSFPLDVLQFGKPRSSDCILHLSLT